MSIVNSAQQRKAQRAAHLVAAVPLLVLIYGPDSDALQLFVRAGVVPMLVLTGILMWQAPRIRRFRKRKLRVNA